MSGLVQSADVACVDYFFSRGILHCHRSSPANFDAFAVTMGLGSRSTYPTALIDGEFDPELAGKFE
jgi:hypothetical protein